MKKSSGKLWPFIMIVVVVLAVFAGILTIALHRRSQEQKYWMAEMCFTNSPLGVFALYEDEKIAFQGNHLEQVAKLLNFNIQPVDKSTAVTGGQIVLYGVDDGFVSKMLIEETTDEYLTRLTLTDSERTYRYDIVGKNVYKKLTEHVSSEENERLGKFRFE